jgi:hypothetical protein
MTLAVPGAALDYYDLAIHLIASIVPPTLHRCRSRPPSHGFAKALLDDANGVDQHIVVTR